MANRPIEELTRAYESASALDAAGVAKEGAMTALRMQVVVPVRAMVQEVLLSISEVAATDVLWEEQGGEPSTDLEDLCFAAQCELRGVLRRLENLPRDPDQLLAECQAASSKVRRTLRAVLATAARDQHQPLPSCVDDEHVSVAVRLRELYTAFRAELPSYDSSDTGSLAEALAHIENSLVVLLGTPDFDRARLSDRAMLRSLQARLFAWLRQPPDVVEGARLYQDIVTTANVLRGINLREELQLHDATLISEACTKLERCDSLGTDDFLNLVARLWELRGRDDHFDVLLRRAASGEPPRDLAWLFSCQLQRMATGLPRRMAAA